MSTQRHLPVMGTDASTLSGRGSALVQICLGAFASLILWLPLGLLGLYVASGLRAWLPPGTSPALGLLAIAPLLLSFALASFLAVAVTARPRRGRWAVVLPILSGVLAAVLAAALAVVAGVLPVSAEALTTVFVLSALSVPSALGGVRLGRRLRGRGLAR